MNKIFIVLIFAFILASAICQVSKASGLKPLSTSNHSDLVGSQLCVWKINVHTAKQT